MMKLILLASVISVTLGAYSGDPRTAAILRSESDITPEGSYQYAYDTENGISAQEAGQLKGFGGTETPAIVAQGVFRYTAPDGTPIEVQYVADENGFQPVGSNLPTPPPIPVAIQRSLEYLAANPQAAEGLPSIRRY